MNGIELKSGVNNCHWNIEGKCCNFAITHNDNPIGFHWDFYSKRNCGLTILGVHCCSGYKPEKNV